MCTKEAEAGDLSLCVQDSIFARLLPVVQSKLDFGKGTSGVQKHSQEGLEGTSRSSPTPCSMQDPNHPMEILVQAILKTMQSTLLHSHMALAPRHQEPPNLPQVKPGAKAGSVRLKCTWEIPCPLLQSKATRPSWDQIDQRGKMPQNAAISMTLRPSNTPPGSSPTSSTPVRRAGMSG